MSLFLDSWEDGTEILCKIMGPKYWRIKMHNRIQKAVAQRDKKSLSTLIRASSLLRKVGNDNYFSSQSMMMIISGLVTAFPNHDKIKQLSQQFYRKISKRGKAKLYKQLLKQNAMGEQESESLPTEEDGVLQFNTIGQYALVHSSNGAHEFDLSLFLANPIAEVDIMSIVDSVPRDRWQIFVDRLDVLTNDIPSWNAFYHFLQNCDPSIIMEIHHFCSSYWRQYHLPREDDEKSEQIQAQSDSNERELIQAKENVFSALSL